MGLIASVIADPISDRLSLIQLHLSAVPLKFCVLDCCITQIECVILMLMERMGLAEDTMNKENDSTMATNQTSDAHMDCQDTLQQNEHSKSIKPNKKKRK